MLTDMFGIEKGDIISLTGSSGKTSLMFTLAEELRDGSVLVTTTTRIFVPVRGSYDHLHIGSAEDVEVCKGITVAAESVTPENKLAGYSSEKLTEISALFDYTLIESDGSNRKPLKAWNAHEPVVLPETSITVGVISVGLVGSEISEKNVHRLDIFIKNFSGSDKILTISHLEKIILHKEGLFKNSSGKRILYINKVESDFEAENAKALAHMFAKHKKGFLSRIVCGSIKNGCFELIRQEE